MYSRKSLHLLWFFKDIVKSIQQIPVCLGSSHFYLNRDKEEYIYEDLWQIFV